MDQINFNPASVQVAPKETVNVKQAEKLKDFDAKLTAPIQQDEVTFTSKQDGVRSKEEKQAIMKRARMTAAGWSIVFSGFSTIYYATSSDKKIAKKFDLDPVKDKDFIKNIRHQQTVQTIPSIFYGAGGLMSCLYNTLKSPDSLKVD